MTFANSVQIEDLVSHGYVVIAIEHTDMATAVLFPDGRTRCFQSRPASGSGDALEQMIAAMKEEVQTGAEDIRLVLDNVMKRSIAIPVSLDLEHVAAMGHSAGDTMVARACQLDTRIRACISEDGELKGIAAFADYTDHADVTQPFLLMEIYLAPDDGELARMRLTRQQWQAYVQKKRQQFNEARVLYEDARNAGQPFDPAEFGFEFSTCEIEEHIADLKKGIAIRNRTYYAQKNAA